MRWIQWPHTARFNARHREYGHLFQGRCKSLLVVAVDREDFLQLRSYIQLNPVRARLVVKATDVSIAINGDSGGTPPGWIDPNANYTY